MGPGLQGFHRGTEVEHGQTPTEGDQLNQHDTCTVTPGIEFHDLQTVKTTRRTLITRQVETSASLEQPLNGQSSHFLELLAMKIHLSKFCTVVLSVVSVDME